LAHKEERGHLSSFSKVYHYWIVLFGLENKDKASATAIAPGRIQHLRIVLFQERPAKRHFLEEEGVIV
jgi:hypothetical protein